MTMVCKRFLLGVVSSSLLLTGTVAAAANTGTVKPASITSSKPASIRSSSLNPKLISVSSHKKTIEVRMRSNRTTGYSWFLTHYDALYLKPVSYRYETPNSGMMGAPGVAVWTFAIVQAGIPATTSISWSSARPWENSAKPTFFTTRVFLLAGT